MAEEQRRNCKPAEYPSIAPAVDFDALGFLLPQVFLIASAGISELQTVCGRHTNDTLTSLRLRTTEALQFRKFSCPLLFKKKWEKEQPAFHGIRSCYFLFEEKVTKENFPKSNPAGEGNSTRRACDFSTRQQNSKR